MSFEVNLLLNLTVLVDNLLVHHPHAVLVHSNIEPHAILKVDCINLSINPANLT